MVQVEFGPHSVRDALRSSGFLAQHAMCFRYVVLHKQWMGSLAYPATRLAGGGLWLLPQEHTSLTSGSCARAFVGFLRERRCFLHAAGALWMAFDGSQRAGWLGARPVWISGYWRELRVVGLEGRRCVPAALILVPLPPALSMVQKFRFPRKQATTHPFASRLQPAAPPAYRPCCKDGRAPLLFVLLVAVGHIGRVAPFPRCIIAPCCHVKRHTCLRESDVHVPRAWASHVRAAKRRNHGGRL